MLDLINRERFWDIGFCTGSVSIEAKLLFPHLHITSFEIREEGRKLMTENCHRFGTPGIEAIIGDFLSVDLSALEAPDAIFIGGAFRGSGPPNRSSDIRPNPYHD